MLIESVNPAGSPLTGRADVLVKGIGFLGFSPVQGDPTERIRLRMVEGQTFTVRELTDTTFLFNAPAGAVGRYTLSITLNNLDWDESGWDGTPPGAFHLLLCCAVRVSTCCPSADAMPSRT